MARQVQELETQILQVTIIAEESSRQIVTTEDELKDATSENTSC